MNWLLIGSSTHHLRSLLHTLTVAALGVLLAIGLIEVPILRGQTDTNELRLPSFEVASIKVNKSPRPMGGIHLVGDRLDATLPTRNLIAWAYGDGLTAHDGQVEDGPDWIKSEWFDIEAKVDDRWLFSTWKKLSFEQQFAQTMLMLQSLLADRFKLNVRHETRDLPVYALVVAKNGVKVREDNSEPWGIRAEGPGKFKATCLPIGVFARQISGMQELEGRQVVDRTGLRGGYSFTFQYTPENQTLAGARSANASPPPDAAAPSLFTALQEQLGLKLESTKSPVDVLVIDHIERPSEN